MQTLSFHDNAELQASVKAMARNHFDLDMLRSGVYKSNDSGLFKACSVGCYAHDISGLVENSNPHKILSNFMGTPQWLHRLQDAIFEGLTNEQRGQFHVDFFEKMPFGKNLEPLRHLLAIKRLERLIALQTKALDAKHGFGVHEAIDDVLSSLKLIRQLHESELNSNLCEWSSAASASRSAARSAASASRNAVSSESAANAATSASRSAASAASAESAESAVNAASAAISQNSAWQQERDDLFACFELMSSSD